MRFKGILLFFVVTLIGASLYAQDIDIYNTDLSKIKVEELSDQQINQIKQRAEESGLSESQMKAALISRGFPATEMSKLEQRLNTLSSSQTSNESLQRNRQENIPIVSQQEPTLSEDQGKESRIFGYNLFRNKNLTFEPSLNIPTPPDYQLGAGDQLTIDIWGASQQNYQLTVSPEGNIYIDNLGPIQVNGLTITEASARIIQRLNKIYSGLSGPDRNTYAQVTLGNTRTINVHILGEVNLPGTFTLSAFATVFNALYASGGPSYNGSFRNIELFRNSKLIASVDVYDFLMNGNQQNNIRLQDQDVIKVNPYQTRVDLTGEVKRPGIYELTDGEKLIELISFSGGFTADAYQKTLTVYRKTDTEQKILNTNKDEFAQFSIHDGDSIPVYPILDRFENKVTINGAVYRPGDYALNEDLSLNELIQKAEGLREDAFLSRALIYRTQEDFSIEIIPINLKEIQNDNKTFLLKKNDVVSIASIFDLRETYYVQIGGEVNEKGRFPFMENSSLKDLIVMARGLKESASLSKVEIARRMKTQESQNLNGKISEIYYFDIDRDLKITEEASKFKLEPFDQVYIRKSPGYIEAQELTVEGEVLYPGKYVLSSKSDRISDLIERAGGLTKDAYPDGAKLIRTVQLDKERQKTIENLIKESEDSLKINVDSTTEQAIGINLTKIIENPESKFNILLQENDKLIIPKEMQTVRLSGALLFPITVRYDKNYSFNKYISMAGGFASNAKKNKSYVIYANGSVDKTDNLLFIKNYPKIQPGAEIVVPQKVEKQKLSTQEAVSISSALTSMALIIVTIINTITASPQ